MTNHINEILDSYTDATLEYDLSTLSEQIIPFKEEINVKNAQGETPIMRYCRKNFGSGVNNLILQTLITQFAADVNIPNYNDQIPLSLFVISEESSMDIDNIKLLLKYTNSQSLLKCNNDLSIVQRILISPILYNQGIVSQILENQLLWDSNHAAMTKQILVILEILKSEDHIKRILDVISKRTDIVNEKTFLHYLNLKNMLVVKELLEYSVDFTSQQAIILMRKNKEIRELLQGEFLTFKNNIIILDQLIHIPDIVQQPDRLGTVYKTLQEQCSKLITQHIETSDVKTLIDSVGFNNNIYHLMALMPTYSVDEITDVYNKFTRNQNVDYLTAHNLFDQTPLSVALLCGNINFISFIKSKIDLYTLKDTKYVNGNTIIHILARVSLPSKTLDQIVSLLDIDDTYITKTENDFGHTCAYDAVLHGNSEFLKWWITKNGDLICIDRFGYTLWHQIAAVFHDKVDEIFDILYQHMPYMINHANRQGITPLQSILLENNPHVLKLFLENFGPEIDFLTKNNAGDTIAHIMTRNLIEEMENEPEAQQFVYHAELVKALMPYKDQIKISYNIYNLNGQTPITILSSNNGLILDDMLYESFFKILWGELVPMHEMSEYDDLIMNMAPSTKEYIQTISTSKLPPEFIYLVHSLSFCIAYCDMNEWGDKLLHVYTTTNKMAFIREELIIHVMNIISNLSPLLLIDLYNTPNKLGQYLLHLAIHSDSMLIIQKLLELDNNLINQRSSPLDSALLQSQQLRSIISDLAHPQILDGTTPIDYLILLEKYDKVGTVLQIMYKMVKENMKVITRFYVETIGVVTEEYKKYIYYDRTVSLNKYDRYMYTKLIKTHAKAVQKADNYYAMTSANLKYIMQNNKNYAFKNVVIFEEMDLTLLSQTLKANSIGYKSSKIYSIMILYAGHASIVVMCHNNNEHHAYVQDSMYSYENDEVLQQLYTTRFNAIKKCLLETLMMKESNVHELQIAEQTKTDSTCALWSLVNAKLIVEQLKQHKTITTQNSDQIHDNIIQSIKSQAPKLLEELKQYVFTCYNSNCSMLKQYLSIDDILSTKEDNILPLYQKRTFSGQIMHSIVNYYYPDLFTVYNLDDNYDLSNKGIMIIIENPLEKDNILNDQILKFLHHTQKQDKLSVCTLIINANNHHWVTLVIAYHNDQYHAYFADSLGLLEIPEYINTILKQHVQHVHIVSIRQQADHYNGGIWAIENARDINNMLRQSYDLEWLKEQFKPERLDRNKPAYFVNIRDNFKQELEAVITRDEELRLHLSGNELLAARDILGLNSCTIHDASTQRRKRAICYEQQSDAFDYNPLEYNVPFDVKREAQLYINIAYLFALHGLKNNANNLKLYNVIGYIKNIGDIIREDKKYHSVREEGILKQYYSQVKSFIDQNRNAKLFYYAQPYEKQDTPLLLDNGKTSSIISYTDNHYYLYSQDYNYYTIFKTPYDTKFNDAKKFNDALFAYRGNRDTAYKILALDQKNNLDILNQLTQTSIQRHDDVASDLAILLDTPNQTIDNIPITVIRQIFLLDAQVPPKEILNDAFFSTYGSQLQLRIDQINTLLSLDASQFKSFKKLIRKYQFKLDDSLLKKKVISKDITDMLNAYYNTVVKKIDIQNIDNLTVENLSELPWQVLDNVMSEDNDITPALKKSMLENIKKIYHSFAKRLHFLGHATEQALFIMPDLFKAVNYNDYAPLLNISGMTLGDVSINTMYHALIDSLTNHLTESRINLLKKYHITNPIFKILTIQSIVELVKNLTKSDPQDPNRIEIEHKIGEQTITIGLMLAEMCSYEVMPLWLGLFAEQIFHDAEYELNLRYQLHIPPLKELWMSFGFQQDELAILKEKSDLIETNFRLISNNTMLAIIRVPIIPDMSKKYMNITKSQIPPQIISMLDEQASSNSRKNIISNHNQSIIEDTTSGYVLLRNYKIQMMNNMENKIFTNSYYQQSYYDAYSSNETIVFDSYNAEDIKQVGPNDNIFTDTKHYNNKTWLRIPEQYTYPIIGKPLNSVMKILSQTRVLKRNTANTGVYLNLDTTLKALKKHTITCNVDFHEGSQEVKITNRGLDKLDQIFKSKLGISKKKPYVVLINIQYKPYHGLKFHIQEWPYFLIQSDNDKLTAHFCIANNIDQNYQVHANIKSSHLDFISMDNTPHHTIVNGTSYGIILEKQCNIAAQHYTMINSVEPKLRLGISLSSNYFIGRMLCLLDAIVHIDGAQGYSNQSTIQFIEGNESYHVGVLGDLQIEDLDTSLSVIGVHKKPYANYSKVLSDATLEHYIINLEKIELIFPSIQRLQTDDHMQNIGFIYNNSVRYNWSSKSPDSVLHISGRDQFVTLQMSRNLDVIRYLKHEPMQTEYVHYSTAIFVDKSLSLKQVFRYNAQLGNTNEVVENIMSVKYLKIFTLIHNVTDTSILLFQDQSLREYYHAFVSGSQININYINYSITQHHICIKYSPQDFTHSGILSYSTQNSPDLINKIEICYSTTQYNKMYTHIVSIIMHSDVRDIKTIYALRDLYNCHDSHTPYSIQLVSKGLTHNAIKHLAYLLKDCNCNIDMIDISGNNLQNSIDELLTALPYTYGLRAFNMSYCSLNDHDVIQLSKTVPKLMMLTQLDLADNNFSNHAIPYLSNMLCNVQRTLTIDVSNNNRVTKGVMDLLKSPTLHCTKHNIISNNLWYGINTDSMRLHDDYLWYIFDIIMHSNLQYESTIRTLQDAMLCNNITHYDISFANQGLQYLGIKSLMQLLESCQCNISLNLSHNNIGDNINAFVPSLSKISNLLMLNVANNHLNDSAAIDIVTNALSIPGITVDLSNNNITERGLIDIILLDCVNNTDITVIVSNNSHILSNSMISYLNTQKTLSVFDNPDCIDKKRIIDELGNQRTARHIIPNKDYHTNAASSNKPMFDDLIHNNIKKFKNLLCESYWDWSLDYDLRNENINQHDNDHALVVHHIDKKYKEAHQREHRDIEYTLQNNDNAQLYDKLVATQEQHVISNTDSRYDAVVQVQNAIGTRHTIARDASKFIDSKPVVNSVYNKLVVDWQGNLLLGYLLFGKKCSGAKCKITQEVVNEPKDLEYAHRLAYSSYAPVIEQNIEDTELVGEV